MTRQLFPLPLGVCALNMLIVGNIAAEDYIGRKENWKKIKVMSEHTYDK